MAWPTADIGWLGTTYESRLHNRNGPTEDRLDKGVEIRGLKRKKPATFQQRATILLALKRWSWRRPRVDSAANI